MDVPPSPRTATRLRRPVALLALAVVVNVLSAAAGPSSVAPAMTSATAVAPDRVPAATPDDARPNIVLFLTDDMRTDELAYMPKTRALLTRQGTSFPNNISPHPLCCPARAELLTGQYAQNNGVRHNVGKMGGYHAFTPTDSMSIPLQDSGYRTAYIGKYLNGYQQTDPLQPGWTVWDALVGPVSRYFSWQVYDEPQQSGYITTELSDRTDRIEREFAAPGSPFFMFINHTGPHEMLSGEEGTGGKESKFPPPADPNSNYGTMFEGQRSPSFKKPSFNKPRPGEPRLVPQDVQDLYLGRIRALQSVDDAVGRLVATLRETGELDNTYIFFASDNGFALGEHAELTKNLLMKEVLNVPLIVSGPDVQVNASQPQITSLVDVARTFLDLAHVQMTAHPLDGKSLVPLLRGVKNPVWRDTTLVQTGSSKTNGVRHPGWADRGVQTTRYLYGRRVNAARGTGEYLYDRKSDRYEMRNLIGAPGYTAVTKELRIRFADLQGCSGSDCNERFGTMPRVGKQARG